MAKYGITLDRDAQESNFSVEEMAPEEILARLEKDERFQEKYSRLNLTQEITAQIADEVLAWANEVASIQYEPRSGGLQVINWETEPIPYPVLRRAGTTIVALEIKKLRQDQLRDWAKVPREGEIKRGLVLEFCNPDYQPKEKEKAELKQWSHKIVENCFFAANDDTPNLSSFLGGLYNDNFDFDDVTIETRRNTLGEPLSLHLQDPLLVKPVIKHSTIHQSIRQRENIIAESLRDYDTFLFGQGINRKEIEPDYLMEYQNQELAYFTSDFLRKHHSNIRSDFKKAKRGFSIAEAGLQLVTWLNNTLTSNASNFNRNRTPPGILAFTGGGIGNFQLEKLKKTLWAHINGTDQSRRFPMMGLPEKGDAKFIDLWRSSREMEYHLWFTLLASLYCRLSGTDPKELSLGSHSDAVRSNTLSDSKQDGIIKENSDRGIKTILSIAEDVLNKPYSDGRNFFQQLTGLDIRCRFVGLQMEDRKVKAEILKEELNHSTSINDILKAEDKPKQTLNIADGINVYDIVAPNNPIIQNAIQVKIQEAQQQQQEQQLQEEGQEPGEEGEDGLTDRDKELMEKYADAEGVENLVGEEDGGNNDE